MSTPAATKSGNLHQHKPASGAADYDRDLKQNQEVIDFILGGLKRFNYVVSGLEITAGSGLTVNWSAGTGVVAGTSYDKTASSGSATDNSSDLNIHLANYVYLNSSGVVTIGTALPSSADYTALAVVFTDAGAIAKVVDCRKFNPAFYAVDTGSANAYAIAFDPAWTSYLKGVPFHFVVTNANTGGSTININSLGVKTIKKEGSVALVSGDLPAGHIAHCVHNGTDVILLNPAKPTNASYGSEIIAGTKMVFYQGSAPTGWTQITTHNDKALRVVSGVGAGSGGSRALSSDSVGDTTLSITQIPSHTHPYAAPLQVADVDRGSLASAWSMDDVQARTSGPTGGGQAHNHALALAYVDVIICQKN